MFFNLWTCINRYPSKIQNEFETSVEELDILVMNETVFFNSCDFIIVWKFFEKLDAFFSLKENRKQFFKSC